MKKICIIFIWALVASFICGTYATYAKNSVHQTTKKKKIQAWQCVQTKNGKKPQFACHKVYLEHHAKRQIKAHAPNQAKAGVIPSKRFVATAVSSSPPSPPAVIATGVGTEAAANDASCQGFPPKAGSAGAFDAAQAISGGDNGFGGSLISNGASGK